MILRKQQKKFKLRFRAFKRKPFLFLRHFLLIIIFRFFGVIICLFFTVLPLPLSNFIQHLMNLNLSLNSLKDILSSVKQLSRSFQSDLDHSLDWGLARLEERSGECRGDKGSGDFSPSGVRFVDSLE